jgi:predicted nucleic acid-binding protein
MKVIDSCVFVSAFCNKDPNHENGKKILEEIIEGKIEAVIPTIAMPEVCGVIRRITGSVEMANEVKKELEDLINSGLLKIEELTKRRMKEASEIAIRLGVKGADAIFISLAQELSAELVTFDNEIKKKIKS